MHVYGGPEFTCTPKEEGYDLNIWYMCRYLSDFIGQIIVDLTVINYWYIGINIPR